MVFKTILLYFNYFIIIIKNNSWRSIMSLSEWWIKGTETVTWSRCSYCQKQACSNECVKQIKNDQMSNDYESQLAKILPDPRRHLAKYMMSHNSSGQW